MYLISINDLTNFFAKCPHALAFIDQTVELCEIAVKANAKVIKTRHRSNNRDLLVST